MRNDRAKETSTNSSTCAATFATATPNAQDHPRARRIPGRCHPTPIDALEDTFLVAVGAADEHTLDYRIKRLREALSGSGRSWRATTARPAAAGRAAFNPERPPQSGHRPVPLPHHHRRMVTVRRHHLLQVGNNRQILLGFNQSNANNNRRAHRPARRRPPNHHPCLVWRGPRLRQVVCGPNASCAAKSTRRASIHRPTPTHRQSGPTSTDIPNKAVVDMGGGDFGCETRCASSPKVAGAHWLVDIVPMMGLDSRSIAVQRLRTLLTANARRHLRHHQHRRPSSTTSPATAPLTGARHPRPPDRPARRGPAAGARSPEILGHLRLHPSHLRRHPALPDLNQLDFSIWLTNSLESARPRRNGHPRTSTRRSRIARKPSAAIYGMLVRLAESPSSPPNTASD